MNALARFRVNCAAAIGVLGVVVLFSGCQAMAEQQESELGYTPSIKSVDQGRVDAKGISSRLLDITELRGETSEPGPGISSCQVDPKKERLFKVSHFWSVTGLAREELAEGMDRLRRTLPQEGWEIISDGEMNNANRTPEILFENTDVEHAVNVTLRGKTDEDSTLYVAVVSACFSTPEGESPKGSY
ncbi:hypothetical protein GCM10009757_00200 [Streptomyces cheonanensis]|uniref:Lipoprotein n=2 Tax=Streptomyces cheonanensis TaxID=312720 RepID=A0ABP5G7D2_9ACTN